MKKLFCFLLILCLVTGIAAFTGAEDYSVKVTAPAGAPALALATLALTIVTLAALPLTVVALAFALAYLSLRTRLLSALGCLRTRLLSGLRCCGRCRCLRLYFRRLCGRLNCRRLCYGCYGRLCLFLLLRRGIYALRLLHVARYHLHARRG